MVFWHIDEELQNLLGEKIKYEPTFRYALKKDLTVPINANLHTRMTGSKTDHFIVYISGCPGLTTTGSGKSSFGLEMAAKHDPEFSVNKLAFYNEQLLDIMEKQAIIGKRFEEVPQVYVRDESPSSLKRRATIEFQTISETLRDSRISLIIIKPVGEPLEIAHYHFQPYLMAEDYSKIRAAVYVPEVHRYRGYYDIHVNVNSKLWNEYMVHKKDFQHQVKERRIGGFDPGKYAGAFSEKYDFDKFIEWTKKGTPKLVQTRLKKYLSIEYPSFTAEERTYILDELKERMKDDGKL